MGELTLTFVLLLFHLTHVFVSGLSENDYFVIELLFVGAAPGLLLFVLRCSVREPLRSFLVLGGKGLWVEFMIYTRRGPSNKTDNRT